MGSLSQGYLSARFASNDWRVYGRNLRPFCLSYIERLAAIESPLVEPRESAVIEPIDVYIASLICSADPLEEPPAFRSWPRVFDFWIRRRVYGFLKPTRVFFAYLDDHYAVPKVWNETGETAGDKINVPWTLAIESKLLEFTNLTSDQIRSMSLSLAIWLSLAHGERHGGTKIISDEEFALMEKLKESG